LELFARQGFHQTSITQIVNASGSYRSAIEWHFGGKERLLLEALDYYFEQKFIPDIRKRWEIFSGSRQNLDGKSVFSFFFREISGLLQDHLGMVLALFTLSFERVHQDKQLAAKVRGAWSRIIELFAWMVELGKKDGLIESSADPAAIARYIIALGQGLFMQWYLEPTDEAARRNLDYFAQALKLFFKIQLPEKIQL